MITLIKKRKFLRTAKKHHFSQRENGVFEVLSQTAIYYLKSGIFFKAIQTGIAMTRPTAF